MMNQRTANKAIMHIAKREGRKVDDIREEISRAIDIAYEARDEHPKWKELFGNRKPTPEELVGIIAMSVAK